MVEEVKLAACPFCGSREVFSAGIPANMTRPNVACMDCGALGPKASTSDYETGTAEAIVRWNTRVPPTASVELADELEQPLRSALRFAASHSAITAAQEKALLARFRSSEQASRVTDGWLPFERAPRDGTIILAYGENLPTYFYALVWEEGEWRYCSQGKGWASAPTMPTHWMPLPEPPAIEASTQGGQQS